MPFQVNGNFKPQKEKKNQKTLKKFKLFRHILLKFEIIQTRIGQIIRLQNNIKFS